MKSVSLGRSAVVRRLEHRVLSALRRAGLGARDSLVVGVSGGLDSCVLLDILSALPTGDLLAVYVDHGLKTGEERDRDFAAVRRLSDELGVVALRRGVVVEGPGGVEAAARLARHAALQELRRAGGAARVVLAHHADDQVETVVLRLLEGAGAAGLAGMQEDTGLILRPLLTTRREELARYAEERGLSYVDDPMNDDERFDRARFRRFLRPVLEAHFPGYASGVLLAADKLRHTADFLDAEGRELSWEVAGPRLGEAGVAPRRTPREAFFAASPAVRLSSILGIVDELALALGPRGLSHRRLGMVLEADRGQAHAVLVDEELFTIEVHAGWISLVPRIVRGTEIGYLYVVHRDATIEPIQGLRISISTLRGASGTGTDAVFPVRSGPVVVRSARPSDRIRVAGGCRTVAGAMSADGVPWALRDLVPVIQDRNGIAAVVGGPFGGRTIRRVEQIRNVPRQTETRPDVEPRSIRIDVPGMRGL